MVEAINHRLRDGEALETAIFEGGVSPAPGADDCAHFHAGSDSHVTGHRVGSECSGRWQW
nr:hypothetical protein [Alcanivorax sp.]